MFGNIELLGMVFCFNGEKNAVRLVVGSKAGCDCFAVFALTAMKQVSKY